MSFLRMGAGPWQAKAKAIQLPSGGAYILPSGNYLMQPGQYTVAQWWDALTQIWRNFTGPFTAGQQLIAADGFNTRLLNPTGSVVGAYVTNGGSGYPNGIYPAGTAPTGSYVIATASAGLANFNVVVGGAINTSVTITNAGVGYNNPPNLQASDPPVGGLRASAIAAVSGGAITGVTVIDQGAGYTAAPTWTITPDARDSITTAAVLTSTTTNSGRVTAVTLGTNGGQGYTATPTISFSASAGSSAAATSVMCYTVTGLSSITGGSANQTAATMVFSSPYISASKTNAPVNPTYEQELVTPRWGTATTTLSSGVAQTAPIMDGGIHESTSVTITSTSAWGTAAPTSSVTGTIAVGGVTDMTYLFSI